MKKLKQIKKKIVQPRCLGSPITISFFPGIIDGCLSVKMWKFRHDIPLSRDDDGFLPMKMWKSRHDLPLSGDDDGCLPMKMRKFSHDVPLSLSNVGVGNEKSHFPYLMMGVAYSSVGVAYSNVGLMSKKISFSPLLGIFDESLSLFPFQMRGRQSERGFDAKDG